jgi:N-acetylneuraminic acid mutarotase
MGWSQLVVAGTPPTARNNHTTAVVRKKLFVHGGHDGAKWLADLHVLDIDKLEWVQPVVSQTPPSARACHTTTRVNRKLYMFGGYDGAKCFNDVDVLDLDTMTWIQPRVSGTLPQARNAHTTTVVGPRLFLFGGHSGNKHLRDLHVLDTETMSWAQPDVQGVPPPGLRGHTANLIGHKIFVFGGYDGRGRSKMLFKLNTESLTWDHPPADEHTPTGRQRHTAVLVGSSQLFIVGGFDGFKWLNDLHVLDVSKLEETAITTAAASNLITNLRQLLNNQSLFPDITFIVEGKPIYAHKAILAVQCDQFQAMFMSGMKESRESEVVIPNWSYSAFLSMLEFLYTGRVIDFQPKIALDLLGLADHYTLGGLKRLCENMLIHNVDNENVCMLFSCSHQYQALDLKKPVKCIISNAAFEAGQTNTNSLTRCSHPAKIIVRVAGSVSSSC